MADPIRRRDYLMLRLAEQRGLASLPVLYLPEVLSSVALSHEPGWLDAMVDPETGKECDA